MGGLAYDTSTSSIPYHHRMIINNDLPDQEHMELIDNSQLLYNSNSRNNNQDNMVAVPSLLESQYVSNEAPALNISHVDDGNIINI